VANRPGATGQFFGTAVLIVAAPGVKDQAVGLFPSGADTCSVEATLESPDDPAASWITIIAATNTPTVITLTGPVAAIRATRATGTTNLNKLVVYSSRD